MASAIDTIILEEYLNKLFEKGSPSTSKMLVAARHLFDRSSTFPIEVVSCVTESGNFVDFCCKYSNGIARAKNGHRGGVDYEGQVYEQVLENVELPKAKYYGSFFIAPCGETIMVLEYLKDCGRLSETTLPEIFLPKAAEWIGKLHSNKRLLQADFLNSYTLTYYRSWIDKLKPLYEKLTAEYAWVIKLIDFLSDNMHHIIEGEQCVIHGEYYPGNILLANNEVCPVDWESAAVGPGGIDLASLIDGWNESLSNKMVEAYKVARWETQNMAPRDFDKLLRISQLYFEVRWFSEYFNEWFQKPKRFDTMRKLAHQFGIT